MQTLEEALEHTPMALLQEMAHFWEVAGEEEAGRPRLIAGMAEQMGRPEAVQRALRRLDAQERDLLRTVLAAGGRIQGPALVQAYGPLRTVALAPTDPAELNPTERLHRKGFLFRAFAAWEGWQGAAFFIPAELWPHLPHRPSEAPATRLQPMTPQEASAVPVGVLPQRDVACLLAFFGREYRELDPEGRWMEQARPALESLLAPDHPAYTGFLLQLARQACLLGPDLEGHLRPTAEGQQWLRAAPWLRTQVLFQAWRDHPGWDDLAAVPELLVERPWAGDLVTPRQRALHHLSQCSPGEWLSADEWIRLVQAQDPEFLRPAGSPGRPQVRLRATEQRLQGPASWDAVEGRYLNFLLQGPLRWLGAVDWGESSQGGAFRLTPVGQALLHRPAAAPELAEEPAIVEGTFDVWVPSEASPYIVYLLEGAAERVRWDRLSQYRLTRPAVQRALERSRREGRSPADTVDRLLESLGRYSRGEVPQNVAYTLREWAAAYGQLCLGRVLLLRAAEAVLLEEILSDPVIRDRCGEPLSPTAVQVEPGQAGALVQRLGELGHLAQVEPGVLPEQGRFDLPLAPRQGTALLGLLWAWAEHHGDLPRSLVELSESLAGLLAPGELEKARRQQVRWQRMWASTGEEDTVGRIP